MSPFSAEADVRYRQIPRSLAGEQAVRESQTDWLSAKDLIADVVQSQPDFKKASDAFLDAPWHVMLHEYSLERQHVAGLSNLILRSYSALHKSTWKGSRLLPAVRALTSEATSNSAFKSPYEKTVDLEARLSSLLSWFAPTPSEHLLRILGHRSTEVSQSLSLMTRNVASRLDYFVFATLLKEQPPTPAPRLAGLSTFTRPGLELEPLETAYGFDLRPLEIASPSRRDDSQGVASDKPRPTDDAKSAHKRAAFVDHANRLAKLGHTDAALDIIYDRIDTMLLAHKYADIEAILQNVDTSLLSVDILLGLLTSSLPARTKLPKRAAFFARVEQEIRRRGEWEDGLLTGLES